MIGIVVPETCWAYKKYNKIIRGIQLVLIPQLKLFTTEVVVVVNIQEYSIRAVSYIRYCIQEPSRFELLNEINISEHTGCPRRNVPDFRRVFLMLKYTDITQNTYVQSWTVTEIMAREIWGLLAVPNTATCTADTSRDNASGLERGMQCSLCLRDALRSEPCYLTAGLSHA